MALVDYERAWTELEAYVSSRPHHGSRYLALKMLEIRARCAEEESMPERALRLYGVQLHEDLRAAARQDPVVREVQQEPPIPLDRRSSADAEMRGPAHLPTLGGHDGRRPVDDSRRSRTG